MSKSGAVPTITERNRLLLQALIEGKFPTIDEAAERAGLTQRGAYAALARPHIRAEFDRMIRERLLVSSFPKAARTIHNLLDAESEYVQADAAKHILAIHGVKPYDGSSAKAFAGIQLTIFMGNEQKPVEIQGVATDGTVIKPLPHADKP